MILRFSCPCVLTTSQNVKRLTQYSQKLPLLMSNKQPRPAAQPRTATSLYTAPQATSATSSIQEILLLAFLTEDSASSNVATLVSPQCNSSQQLISMWFWHGLVERSRLAINMRELLFPDGRGLRHKYFKDYKDYLGRWGNVDSFKTSALFLKW